ncbi:phosphoglycerate mutase [Lentilactobacillus fungorum]|uniref:Phosphoglycerate mutase n=1 Tax=Lentilactobacillus fungorum TaxID=2201250 RepID=A0ABQ3W0K3_9LACO|nr:histidine phosphatase family protein [Lentilactobacillus fungorum]GHP14012.1 phosphoglycerate mutase [Lentilactobacillus fungorum]
MKKIYFVRHGQTLLNRFRRMQGWVDSPLTQKGEAQAVAAGKRLADLDFQLAVSSDMLRAIHTLDIILAQNHRSDSVKREVHQDIREIYFGSFEAVDSVQTWNIIGGPLGTFNQEDLIKRYGLLKVRDFMHDADPFHEAETAAQLEARINSAVTHIQDELSNGENALVVSHGTFLRNLATNYSGDDKIAKQPQNGSVIVLDVTSEPVVISNDL